jgi:Zn-dependent protease with chaperone function
MAAAVGILVASSALVELQSSLSVRRYNIWIALILAIGPWLLLALAGVMLSLTNTRIAPLVASAKRIRSSPVLPGVPFMTFQGLPVEILSLPLPLAFCVSDPSPRIVISQMALNKLTKDELTAVLWHEYAHARLRHNSVKSALRVIAALSRFAKATRFMSQEVESLIELSADQYALRHCSTETLISARTKLKD